MPFRLARLCRGINRGFVHNPHLGRDNGPVTFSLGLIWKAQLTGSLLSSERVRRAFQTYTRESGRERVCQIRPMFGIPKSVRIRGVTTRVLISDGL